MFAAVTGLVSTISSVFQTISAVEETKKIKDMDFTSDILDPQQPNSQQSPQSK